MSNLTKATLVASALFVAACATDKGPSDPTESAPRFLAFGANKTKVIGESDRLVITAALTDPDGIDDVVGGTLSRSDTGVLVGAFATSAAEGAYSMDVDVKTLLGDSEPVRRFDASVPIALTAEFFDQAGNRTSSSLDVTFECPEGEIYAEGACVAPFEYTADVDHRDQCLYIYSTIDTAMKCGEMCHVFGETPPADQDATDLMLAYDGCYCGPCIETP